MDKNSIIGLVLITAIMLGWLFLSKPKPEEVARQKRLRDSIELVQKQNIEQQGAKASAAPVASSDSAHSIHAVHSAGLDSARKALDLQQFGQFSNSAQGEKKELTIENEFLKATISTRGGILSSVLLKNYKTFD